ncbi:hypothetical protein LP420_38400 [Massilia sp. B-10]|nr:hypothetical protein LP420_38400 [Massilia sp. B-10]
MDGAMMGSSSEDAMIGRCFAASTRAADTRISARAARAAVIASLRPIMRGAAATRPGNAASAHTSNAILHPLPERASLAIIACPA